MGIIHYNGETWETITTDDGLISNRINQIFIDEQNGKWISTTNGISYIGESEPELYTPEYTPPTSVMEERQDDLVDFLPNPASQNIKLKNYENFTHYILYSSGGNIVQEGIVEDNIDLRGLQEGFYTIVFISPDKGTVAKKLIIN